MLVAFEPLRVGRDLVLPSRRAQHLDGRFLNLYRLGETPGFRQRGGKGVAEAEGVLEAHSGLRMFHGGRHVAELVVLGRRMQPRKIVVGRRVVRLQAYRFLEVRNGTVVVAGLKKQLQIRDKSGDTVLNWLNASVEISIVSPDYCGAVAADALYLVEAPTAPERFTWSATLPAAGDYTLYARWPSDGGRTAAAAYAVTHSGGTANLTLDQRAGAGEWRALGSYHFDPALGPATVVLTGGPDGTLAADALRFVAADALDAGAS